MVVAVMRSQTCCSFTRFDYLAVAYADEGIELRKSGITLPIMIMNPEISTFDALTQYHLEPDLYSFNILNEFDSFLKRKELYEFPVHIELETGMNRLGFDLVQLPSLIDLLKKSSFKIQSVFSHLVASEDPHHDGYTRIQAESFLVACNEIQKSTGYSFIKHIDNSAGISRHPDLQLDMVRLGIGLYGIDSGASGIVDLKEVSSLKTTIAQIKYVKEGENGWLRKKRRFVS